MKKICFFIGSMNLTGGTERVTSVIANELLLQKFQVNILSVQCGDNPFFNISDGVIVDQLYDVAGRGVTRLPKTIFNLRRYLVSHKIDILIVVDSILSIYTLPAVCGLNIRHICWEHFNYNVSLGKRSRVLARKLAAKYSDDIVTLTDRDKKLWMNNNRMHARLTTVPNPITIEPPISTSFSRDKIILAVGRLTYQKGFDLLLQAWSLFSKKFPDWRLRIIGDGEDKSMLEKLRKELFIESSSEILPKTKNIASHYQQASFFVMSSRFEGLPLVLIEAQAYGLPAISFDCDTGPSEIIENNKSGWLCDADNVAALADGLSDAICFSQNPINYKLYSTAAVMNTERFQLSNVVSDWVALLSK
ncbi:glycosyltransferase family 4 protein [Edwardsiella tarda]|uniref:glycosyltransferase family 4 protein n=1 Tax=Edwardsiella tarda TaxID=636 RepID=UPI000942F06E|nr:glycosyltransferase family 4 protein [Edwardsiella tarda]